MIPEGIEQPAQTQEQPPFKLHLGMLKGVNLTLYPKEKTHYLAYALQFGLELPSLSTMRRSERRNMRKSGAQKAANATGRAPIFVFRPKGRKLFVLPDRFGGKVNIKKFIGRVVRGRGRGRGRGKLDAKGKKAERVAIKPAVFRPKRAIPGRKPISLPTELVRKQKVVVASKEALKAFRIHSPDWIELRAERDRFREQIEKYRTENPGMEEQKTLPEYFRKRKANQKRRRKEKHELIQANRKALQQIFGNAIFQKGWPISRREIKLALGIKEQDHDKEVSVDEFMKMAEQQAKEANKSQSKPKSTNKSRPKSKPKRL